MTAGRIVHAATRDAKEAIANRLERRSRAVGRLTPSGARRLATGFLAIALTTSMAPVVAFSDARQVRQDSGRCQEGLDLSARDFDEALGRGVHLTVQEEPNFWPRYDEFYKACAKALVSAPTDAKVNARMANFQLLVSTTPNMSPLQEVVHKEGVDDAKRAIQLAHKAGDWYSYAWACNVLHTWARGSEYRCPEAERLQANSYFAPSRASSRSDDDAARDEEMQQQRETEQRNEDAQRAQRGY